MTGTHPQGTRDGRSTCAQTAMYGLTPFEIMIKM